MLSINGYTKVIFGIIISIGCIGVSKGRKRKETHNIDSVGSLKM
jgi:hypothetical protein